MIQRVLVTGASSGIGAATAVAFAARRSHRRHLRAAHRPPGGGTGRLPHARAREQDVGGRPRRPGRARRLRPHRDRRARRCRRAREQRRGAQAPDGAHDDTRGRRRGDAHQLPLARTPHPHAVAGHAGAGRRPRREPLVHGRAHGGVRYRRLRRLQGGAGDVHRGVVPGARRHRRARPPARAGFDRHGVQHAPRGERPTAAVGWGAGGAGDRRRRGGGMPRARRAGHLRDRA